jgi:transposase
MDTFVNQGHGRRRRRQYSREFKRDAVAACLAPGVSMASVALANGLNANVLRRWVNEHETSKSIALATTFATKPSDGKSAQPTPVPVPLPAFIPVELGHDSAPAQDIKIELRTGTIVLNITWPVSAASQCAAWVAAVIR